MKNMSTYTPSFNHERLKEPVPVTMYNDSSGFCESIVRENDIGLLRDCRNHEMLMGSHITPFPFRSDVGYEIGNVISDSKYLKVTQKLLDDTVNVKKGLKQYSRQESMDNSKEVFGESGNECESIPVSAAEKRDLQNKMAKLSSMLNEVDRKYKQYYNQIQIVVSSFDAFVGCEAASPYTSLTLQTISCQFRLVRDAINNQMKVISRRLGETELNGNRIAIPKLQYVDQRSRVRKFGSMHQHIWRPQRGLPESSVSILRAWLFEHFLHPYPKDSEKVMLGRQSGLTRSQVANWFINARVRLWKPMVEEMYKKESEDAAMDSNSSSEIPPKSTSLNQEKYITQENAASSYQACEMKTESTIPNSDSYH